MQFEYDAAKSAGNAAKHGIDFVEAQQIWRDEYRLQIPSRRLGEPRELMIGRIADKLWTAIFVEREDRVRLISVRRARENECELYENQASEDKG